MTEQGFESVAKVLVSSAPYLAQPIHLPYRESVISEARVTASQEFPDTSDSQLEQAEIHTSPQSPTQRFFVDS